jgi:hypothetical protein
MITHTQSLGYCALLSVNNQPPNGWRYPLVGGTRQHRFDGINFKPRKLLKNAQTPTSRVHAVLGAGMECQRFCSRTNTKSI